MILAFSAGACGILPATSSDSMAPVIGLTDMNNTAMPATQTLFAQTRAAVSTSTDSPTDTPTSTSTPIPFKPLEGLRVVNVGGDNNLYVQDSGVPAIRLAQNVKGGQFHRPPLISDDGQKIIFFRAGEATLDSVYVINADGTGEQVLINSKSLSAFGKAYEFTTLYSLTLVHGTHLLLFNTYQHGNLDPESAGWLPLVGNDLFVVNIDTGEIKQLKAPWQGGNFLAAPNGKWVAVQTLDHIDVLDMQGRIVYRNLVTYPKTEAHVVVPMAWTPDSKELIVLPSEIPLFAGVTVNRTVWRYSLDGTSGIEVKLNPNPTYDAYAISPDGNWIVYADNVSDPNEIRGVYLSNLREGTSQLLYTPPLNVVTGFRETAPLDYESWSPDSVYFIVQDGNTRLFLGNIYREFVYIGHGRGIEVAGWIDNTHYLMESGVLHEVDTQELVQVVSYFDTFVFIKP